MISVSRKVSLLNIVIFLFSIQSFFGQEVIKYFKDFDIFKFEGINEIPKTNIIKNARYLKIIYQNNTIENIYISDTSYDGKKHTTKTEVKIEDGFKVVKFPKVVDKFHYGNWLFFKNKNIRYLRWLVKNDTVYVINADSRKWKSASLFIIEKPVSDTLKYNRYAIGDLDITVHNGLPSIDVYYLLNRCFNAGDKLIYFVEYIDFGALKCFYSNHNGINASEESNEKSILACNELLSLSRKSLFWFLYYKRGW